MSNLYEIKLPEGDVLGFDIGGRWENGTRQYDPRVWLSQGYAGVRFIGAGKGKTHIRPSSGVWTTIGIDQHDGIVRFESLSLHGHGRAAIQAGRDNKAGVKKKFKLELADFELIAEENSPTYGRVAWGIFSYQCNIDARDGDIWWGPAREHAFYGHAYAGPGGGRYERLRFHECAAECIKGRFDPIETLWAGPKVTLAVIDCTFKDWYRPWSSRGGGGVVLQGVGCDVLIQGNEFWAPPDASHTRCIMVDDDPNHGIAAFYDVNTGQVGKGFATGNIVIRRNLFRAGPGTVNLTPCIRVGNLFAGTHKVAKSLLIEQNAVYGQNLQLQLSNIPSLTVRENNTPQAKEYAQALGVDVTFEAGIPTHDAVIPLSKYIVQAVPKP
jgi:hypothetical protein